jgi:hypothetical protein
MNPGRIQVMKEDSAELPTHSEARFLAQLQESPLRAQLLCNGDLDAMRWFFELSGVRARVTSIEIE